MNPEKRDNDDSDDEDTCCGRPPTYNCHPVVLLVVSSDTVAKLPAHRGGFSIIYITSSRFLAKWEL